MRRTSLGIAVLVAAWLSFAATANATWTALSPNDPATTVDQFTGVACTSSTNCEAVGAGDDAALIERYDGTNWTTQTPATPPAGTTSSGLLGVGCSASNACTAVGSYLDGNFDEWALVERWTTSWGLQTFPRPSGAISSRLAGVACVTSSFCMAVGSFVDTASQPLAGTWNGTSWTQSRVPTVAGSIGTDLSAVSCSSTTSCIVIGNYINSSGTVLPYAAAYSSGSWTLHTVPTPRGASATFLTGLSCTSSSACTAVGYGTNATGVFAVAERYSGSGTWTEQTLATAPAGSTGSALVGVGCTSSTFCAAVGHYVDSVGKQHTYSQTWTAWTVRSTPNPVTYDAAGLRGVACVSSTFCVSGGYYYDGGGAASHPLAQRWN